MTVSYSNQLSARRFGSQGTGRDRETGCPKGCQPCPAGRGWPGRETDERRLHPRRALMTPLSDFTVVAAIRLAVLVVPVVVSAVSTPLPDPVDQGLGQPNAEPRPPTVFPSRKFGHGSKLTDLLLPARAARRRVEIGNYWPGLSTGLQVVGGITAIGEPER